MNNPKISIVIGCAFDKLEQYTKPCVEAIQAYTSPESYECILVANGCTDNTVEWAKTLPSNFKCLEFSEPLGYAKANNAGIKEAKGEYVVLLNNDAILMPQERDAWVNMLLKSFSEQEKVGITGVAKAPATDCPVHHEFMVFFCVMIPRKVLDDVGLLDESFKIGACEDMAWCIEAVKKGYKQVRVPDAEGELPRTADGLLVSNFPLYHKGEGTVHDYKDWEAIFANNRRLLVEKYKPDALIDAELEKQHASLYNEIFVRNAYGVKREEIEGRYVLDIGANRGYFSLLCTRYGAKKIVSVEAHPDNYNDLLLPNIERFGIKTTPVLAALSDTDGVEIGISDKDTGSEIGYGSTKTVTVTLDTLFKQHIPSDLTEVVIKMDCEGAEFDAFTRILKHGDPNVFDRVSVVYIEIHGDTDIHSKWRSLKHGEEILMSFGFLPTVKIPIFGWTVGPNGERVDEHPLPLCTYRFERVAKDHPRVLEAQAYVRNRPLPRRKPRVLCTIPTKDRYEMLPLSVQSAIMQTLPPAKILILDDGEHKHPKDVPGMPPLLRLMAEKGIEWATLWGYGKGAQHTHNWANFHGGYEYIWSLDDDEVAEPDVLERLMDHMAPDVGAVGGAVVTPFQNEPGGTNTLATIYHTPNLQWSRDGEVREVEHLHSSFVYRAGVVPFCLDLSPVSHRGETIFTHMIKRAGYRLIADTGIITHHLKSATGGIRSHNNQFFYEHDEKVFTKFMEEWGYKLITLNCGLGDHLAFLNVVPRLQKKYKHLIVGACYPETLAGLENVTVIPVAQSENWCKDNVYKWMTERSWKGTLVEAFATMYGVGEKE